jgi:hypothetical protein
MTRKLVLWALVALALAGVWNLTRNHNTERNVTESRIREMEQASERLKKAMGDN